MKHKRKLKPSRILFLVLVFIGIPSLLFFLLRPVSNTQNMPEDTPQTTDLADLLAYAKEPLGQVMYVWGGGWNEEDTGAGTESRHLGLSPAWKTFADAQDATYDLTITSTKSIMAWIVRAISDGFYTIRLKPKTASPAMFAFHKKSVLF